MHKSLVPDDTHVRLTPRQGLVYGTLAVGTLDALDAVIFFGLMRGATPVQVFQGIASGLLGRESFSGGAATALLGLAIHYFIAFSIVGTYIAASRRMPILVQRPVLFGVLYGLAVYFVMNLVVIPLSAIGPMRLTLSIGLVNGLAIHVLGVGLPSAIAAALSLAPPRAPARAPEVSPGHILFRDVS